jgi:hypothetical protein
MTDDGLSTAPRLLQRIEPVDGVLGEERSNVGRVVTHPRLEITLEPIAKGVNLHHRSPQ